MASYEQIAGTNMCCLPWLQNMSTYSAGHSFTAVQTIAKLHTKKNGCLFGECHSQCTVLGRRACGQFSKVQSGNMGRGPRRFELSKGMLNLTMAMLPGFETINLKFCDMRLRELTVGAGVQVREGGGRRQSTCPSGFGKVANLCGALMFATNPSILYMFEPSC